MNIPRAGYHLHLVSCFLFGLNRIKQRRFQKNTHEYAQFSIYIFYRVCYFLRSLVLVLAFALSRLRITTTTTPTNMAHVNSLKMKSTGCRMVANTYRTAHTHTNTNTRMQAASVLTEMCKCLSVCVCVCACLRCDGRQCRDIAMAHHAHIRTYIYLCICMYVCMYIYLCICMFI